MDASNSSNTSGGVSSYPYSTAPSSGGDKTGARTSFSQNDVLCNGTWMTADPASNSYEALQASYGTRAMPHKRESSVEDEVAALKEQCDEKDKTISCLKDKLSELEKYGQQRESDFEQKMEETLQQLTMLKKAAFLANGNFMKTKSEFEGLKSELQAAKEREVELHQHNLRLKDEIQILQERMAKISQENFTNKTNSKEHELKLKEMSSSIKEEVQILRWRLGEIREEVVHGSVNISQQAAQLQNLLNACKAGLTSLRGHSFNPNDNKLSSRASLSEHPLDTKQSETNNAPKQRQQKENANLKYQRQSEHKGSRLKSTLPLFRAEDYFDPQPSEFDFLTSIAVENYPVRAASLVTDSYGNYQKEITRVDNSPPKPAPSDVRSDKVVTNHFVNEPQLSDKPKVYSGYSVQSAKAKGRLNPRPLPTCGVIKDVNVIKPLPIQGAATSTTNIWNPYSTPPKAAGNLNGRPLPVDRAVGSYQSAQTGSAKEEHGGFFSRTVNSWFGFY